MYTDISANAYRNCTVSFWESPWKLSSWNLFLETLNNASSGHGSTQLMVVQFTRLGNILILTFKLSPTGDMHSTTWMLSRARWMKKSFSLSTMIPNYLATVLRCSKMSSQTDSSSKSLAISPVLRMLFMFSRKSS